MVTVMQKPIADSLKKKKGNRIKHTTRGKGNHLTAKEDNKKHGKREKSQNKQKKKQEMAIVILCLQKITPNVKGLNSQIKRHRVTE